MAKQTIVAARLNALDFFRFWFLSAVHGSDIYYNERKASRLALGLAKGFRRFHPAHLDFNKKTKDGSGLLYVAQENINSVLAEVLKPAQALPYWLKTSLFWETRGILEYEIVFIESARVRADELKLDRVTFYGLSTPFFHQTQNVYASQGISLKALPRPSVTLKMLATPFARFFMKRSPTEAGSGRPAVWVEYGIPGVFEHAFWRKHVKKADFDIIYYLDRADTPPHSEVTRVIEKDGVVWIDLHAPQLMGLSDLRLHQLLKTLWRSLSMTTLSWGLRAMLFKHQVWHAAYTSVFQKQKVKLLIQHQDRSWAQAVQADAVEKAGGIMLGYHWSNLSICMDQWFITAQHVYFVWGKSNYEMIVRKGNSCQHILPSGMWIEESASTDELREFARAPGFKMAIFDSDVSYDIHHSPKTLSEFIKAILDLLHRHTDWKALFKFKFAEAPFLKELPDGGEIWQDLTALIQEKRILLTDPHLSPITAAKSADLSICYSMNSAGICAQVRDARAVHWNVAGIRYPLMHQPGQKIVYSTLNETLQAVEAFAAGDQAIGDLSRWRTFIDYFGDTKAGERIAGFIQDYMSAVIAEPGTSGLTISDRIAGKYIEQNKIGREFYKNFAFWV